MPAWIGCIGGSPIGTIPISGSTVTSAAAAVATSNAYRRLIAQWLGEQRNKAGATPEVWWQPDIRRLDRRVEDEPVDPNWDALRIKDSTPDASVTPTKDGALVIDFAPPVAPPAEMFPQPQLGIRFPFTPTDGLGRAFGGRVDAAPSESDEDESLLLLLTS